MAKWLFPVFLCLIFSSCRKEERDRDQSAMLDFTIAKTMFDDAFQIVDEIADETDGIRSTPSCVESITVDTTTSPKSILIDFGNTTCTDIVGTRRQGQILVTFTGRYRDVGTQIVITPINYQVNNYILTGTKTITNMGLNESELPYFNVEVINGKVSSSNNDFQSTWNSNMVRTWTEGSLTVFLQDDAYSVTGTAEGVDRNGNAYELTITRPLEFSFVCPWIYYGKFELQPEGKSLRTLDYGNGVCDNNATVVIDGFTYSISI